MENCKNSIVNVVRKVQFRYCTMRAAKEKLLLNRSSSSVPFPKKKDHHRLSCFYQEVRWRNDGTAKTHTNWLCRIKQTHLGIQSQLWGLILPRFRHDLGAFFIETFAIVSFIVVVVTIILKNKLSLRLLWPYGDCATVVVVVVGCSCCCCAAVVPRQSKPTQCVAFPSCGGTHGFGVFGNNLHVLFYHSRSVLIVSTNLGVGC